MKKLYFFSGLGADYRAFQKLDLSGFKGVHIDWIPTIKKESIASYATRLLEQIECEKPLLIGLSFGGIIAVEVAKQMETEKVILISSAKNKNEIPKLYRIAGSIGLDKIIPLSVLIKMKTVNEWFFGIKNPSDKQLLLEILRDTDLLFLRWAINKIVNWNNFEIPKNCIHIHGEKDRILPLRNCKYDYKIENGGHFMVVNKNQEINQLLKRVLC